MNTHTSYHQWGGIYKASPGAMITCNWPVTCPKRGKLSIRISSSALPANALILIICGRCDQNVSPLHEEASLCEFAYCNDPHQPIDRTTLQCPHIPQNMVKQTCPNPFERYVVVQLLLGMGTGAGTGVFFIFVLFRTEDYMQVVARL